MQGKIKIAFINNSNQDIILRGAGYVASVIIDMGIPMDFYNTCYLNSGMIASAIVRKDYSLLMISSMSIDFYKTLEIIALIKQKKRIPVLVGGIHATIVRAELLKKHPLIDFVCVGEGEVMIRKFIEGFEKGDYSKVNNLIYRRDDEIVENPHEYATDLNQLPPFQWKLFSKNALWDEEGSINVFATRGCPYNCSYCCNAQYLTLYGKGYLRFRDPDIVMNEIKYLIKRHKPRELFFGDEMILSDAEYIKELFGRVKSETGVPYGCMARVEHIDEELCRILKDTGCVYMGAGIECGDEPFRKKFLNRHMTNDQIVFAFSAMKKSGIKTASFNMIGFPVDYDEMLTESTINLNKLIRPESVQVSVFYPFPGTTLYDYCVKKDLIDPDRLKNARDYYGETVLKNKSVLETKERIDRVFGHSVSPAKKFIKNFRKTNMYRLRKVHAVLSFPAKFNQ